MPRPSYSLDLFGDSPLPPSPPPLPFPAVAPRAVPFWLCLYLPDLALEAVPATDTVPRAIQVEEGQRSWLVAADRHARALGVRPGMPSGSALALLPELRLQPRSPEGEALALRALANRLGAFTPAISLAGDAVLLEVRGSLRLFGGLAALRRHLEAALRRCGHRCIVAGAPTARGALWLARSGCADDLPDPVALARALGALPVDCTGWPAGALGLLEQIGVATLRELQRLPREGLARRLGTSLLRELDEAWGRAPELHRWHVPAATFKACLELPAETVDVQLLGQGCRALVAQLDEVLVRRQAGVRQLWLTLVHAGMAGQRPADTRLRLGLRAATTRAGLLQELLELRLAGLLLPAPVAMLVLQARLEADCPLTTRAWLPGEQETTDRLAALIERLRARLGDAALRGLTLYPDHRPEHSWRWIAPATAPAGGTGDLPPPVMARRPTWLLRTPRRLGEVSGLPTWHGPLALSGPPERVESGWWDGGDVRREYYTAHTARGGSCWVFRDLGSGGWYLHGIFR
jgi:protein ImuB